MRIARWSAFVVVAALAAGCGVRTEPRPPEDTAPRPPANLAAKRTAAGVRVSWDRPDRSMDGERLYDLAGFVVERRSRSGGYEKATDVAVDDNERIRPQTRFRWVDEEAPIDADSYRVYAYTADGQAGQASEADVTIPPPAPSQAPVESSAPAARAPALPPAPE